MHRFLFLVSFLIFTVTLSAQVVNPYLFLDWKNSENFELHVGQISYDDSFEATIQSNKDEFKSNKNSKEEALKFIQDNLKQLPSDRPDILFYIHGFGAYRSYFVRLNNKTLQQEIVDKEGSTIGMHLSLTWNVGYNYLAGIPKAIDIGNYYGSIISETIKMAKEINPDARILFVTHSMGNRVYLGVFDHLLKAFDQPMIDKHIMAAPDIESECFMHGGALEKLPLVNREVVVYRHNTDRTLTFSSEISEKPRLGLTGFSDEQMNKISDIVSLVDVSLLNDNERYDFGNHNYYYQSPTIRQDIFNVLFNKNRALEQTRKILKHNKRFVLQFPEVVNE